MQSTSLRKKMSNVGWEFLACKKVIRIVDFKLNMLAAWSGYEKANGNLGYTQRKVNCPKCQSCTVFCQMLPWGWCPIPWHYTTVRGIQRNNWFKEGQ